VRQRTAIPTIGPTPSTTRSSHVERQRTAFAQASVRYEVELVRLLSPDVAVTGVRQTYVDQEGKATSRGLPTYVWIKDDDWYIAVGQNTAVPVD